MIERIYVRKLILIFALLPSLVNAEQIDLQTDERTVFYGEHRGSKLGEGVTAGDFDGDGIDDLLIGASWADGNDAGDRKDCGRCYVFFGSPERSAPEGAVALAEADILFIGIDAGDQLGRRVLAGDMDGDGFDEIILATMYADGPDRDRESCGEAYVFFGRNRDAFPDTIDLSHVPADFTVSGAGMKDFLTGEATTGDLDGDQKIDLILGAFYGDGPGDERYHAGEVAIIFGRERGDFPKRIDLSTDPVPTVYGAEPSDTFGRAIACGDLDGDGFEELIVGAYYGDGPGNIRINAGETYVIWGRQGNEFPMEIDLADGEQTVIYGEWDGDVSGRSVASCDLDGDGKDEVLISAHLASIDREANDRSDEGMVYILFGGSRDRFSGQLDLRVDADCRITGTASIDNLGWPVVPCNWNDDGREDLLIIAKQSRGGVIDRRHCGQAYILTGRARGDFPEYLSIDGHAEVSVAGANEGDLLAFDAVVLDWNGDGKPEIALGVPESKGATSHDPRTGEVNVVYTR